MSDTKRKTNETEFKTVKKVGARYRRPNKKEVVGTQQLGPYVSNYLTNDLMVSHHFPL